MFSMSPRSTSTNSNRPVCASDPLLPANCQTTIAATTRTATMMMIFFMERSTFRMVPK